MWPRRDLVDLLGIHHPILQAPMVGTSTVDLAVAVSEAGGLGIIACGSPGAVDFVRESRELRRRTLRPFGLNFFVPAALPLPDAHSLRELRERLAPLYAAKGLGAVPSLEASETPSFDDNIISDILDARPALVTFHFGLPPAAVVTKLRAAGIALASTATTVQEAWAIEAAGFDAIIAQGYEAGGHRGSHHPTRPGDGVGTLALVPQVVDATTLPVIAAGGIGDGRGIAAALALGAAGVQMGTAFLCSPEAGTDAPRRALLDHAQDTDTVVTEAISGRSARAHRSALSDLLADMSGRLPPYPKMYTFTDPLIDAGADDATFHLYGQAAALSRAEPAGETVARLIRETEAAIRRLAPTNED